MCLVAVAWRAHPRYPLIVIGNRDELHGRPAAPAAWWDGATDVLGGRDLVAGGSWLAVSRQGRFAVITNNPQRPPGPVPGPSRGQLVRDFVSSSRPSGRFLDAVQASETRYPGFCLLAGTRTQVRGFVTPRGDHPGRWTLSTGVTAISNSPLDQPWPKVRYLQQALVQALANGQPDPGQLLALLARHEPVAATATDDGNPAARRPFVIGQDYGTRASTVVMMDAAGHCRFIERRFDSSGTMQGETLEDFQLG